MSKEVIEIVKPEYGIAHINGEGNISYDSNFSVQKVYLTLGSGFEKKKISKEYFGLTPLWDDHYIVSDVTVFEVGGHEFWGLKEGVIRLKRGQDGKVIPFLEEEVVPIAYDAIYPDNSKMVIASSSDRSTYINVDVDSDNYGFQLMPAILTYAGSFNLKYDGYAECGFDDIEGYVSKKMTPIMKLSQDSLLPESKVKQIIKEKIKEKKI